MKIRLIGSPDLIKLWSIELETAYGITGQTYVNRNSQEVRYYVDLDDRKAEVIISKSNTKTVKKVKL